MNDADRAAVGRLRAQVLQEAAADVLTLADAVTQDGTPVFGTDEGRWAVRIVAGYLEGWASRPWSAADWKPVGE